MKAEEGSASPAHGPKAPRRSTTDRMALVARNREGNKRLEAFLARRKPLSLDGPPPRTGHR